MFRKKIFLLSSVGILFFLNNCGGSDKKPEDVVKDVEYSLCEGKIDKQDVTMRTQKLLSMLPLNEYAKLCKKRKGIADIKVETHKINDTTLEYTALIKFGDGTETTDHGYIVKTNEGWKLDVKKQ